MSGEDRDEALALLQKAADVLSTLHHDLAAAMVHGQQILRLVQLYEDGEAGVDSTLEAIRAAAQAIVSGPEDDDEPEAGEPPGPDQ